MATAKRAFVPNQVFVGLPWKNVRPRYDKILKKLEAKFPLYFTIVGRDDGQDAVDLFELIKARIGASSAAIFDATGGNANVSLEYGYAEGIGVPRSLFLSVHRAAQAGTSTPIIADLGGKRRVQYKTADRLSVELHRYSREHAYTVRFEKALPALLKGLPAKAKKAQRSLALRLIHSLDGRAFVRRAEVVQLVQAKGYRTDDIEAMLKRLHGAGLLRCSVGRESKVRVA
jgi:hypothetical protein